jgi:hypothetical protein
MVEAHGSSLAQKGMPPEAHQNEVERRNLMLFAPIVHQTQLGHHSLDNLSTVARAHRSAKRIAGLAWLEATTPWRFSA